MPPPFLVISTSPFWHIDAADSDEAGHAFQSEAGRYSELMPARIPT
jgi:hypothetical protein